MCKYEHRMSKHQDYKGQYQMSSLQLSQVCSVSDDLFLYLNKLSRVKYP